MIRLRNIVQHFGNPLHVFCRLKDFGISAVTAHKISLVYERYLYKKVLH